jgi:hypothetical protein
MRSTFTAALLSSGFLTGISALRDDKSFKVLGKKEGVHRRRILLVNHKVTKAGDVAFYISSLRIVVPRSYCCTPTAGFSAGVPLAVVARAAKKLWS